MSPGRNGARKPKGSAIAEYRRYAVYYAPPATSALADFGAAWLGWDMEAGAEAAHPDMPGLPRPVAEITATPRKYGFHATLKPPFRLLGDFPALADAVDRLAADIAPFDAPPLALGRLGPFLALIPAEPSEPLADLAARAVRDLDAHRAPPDEAELAKRRAGGLSARREELLARWGYPYVMEEFRFHLTLTGPLTPEDAAAAEAALAPVLAPLIEGATPVREVSLCGEGEDGRFRVIRRAALTGRRR